MTHYWPISDGEMLDQIGTSHMKQGDKTSFVTDRFGNPNSALALNGGWTQVPEGVYFNMPEFTISVWIKPLRVGQNARILDFGNGSPLDNIVLGLSNGENPLTPFFAEYEGRDEQFFKSDNKTKLELNKWQFLAFTFEINQIRIYLDGKMIFQSEDEFNYIQPKLKKKCYIGKSNWPKHGFSYSFLDDLRFYNKSLDLNDIQNLMVLGRFVRKKLFQW